MEGRTLKWTLRYYECLFSMALAQAYNIYRFLHGTDALSHHNFLWEIYSEWYNNSFLHSRSGPCERTIPVVQRHSLIQSAMVQYFPRINGVRVQAYRRKRCRCAECSSQHEKERSNSFTTYLCPACDVFLHPHCSAAYHERILVAEASHLDATSRLL